MVSKGRDLVEQDLKWIWHPCSQMKDYEDFPPVVIDHAQGLFLYDTDGNRYADVVSSWWCNLLGHCHPRISAAIQNQLTRLEHVIFAGFTHEPAIELCSRLAELLPPGLEKFFFTDNGSSAVEVAMKMSFQYHQQTGHAEKTRFIALSDAYHGETLGALSVGGVDLYSKLYKPLLLDVLRPAGPDCYRCVCHRSRETCEAECFAAMEQTFREHGHETAAVLVEPLVQGAAGMKIYSPKYLVKLRRLCDQYNVLLIADEIAVGFGRTGKMFACEHAGISPDLICLSKGLTGGYMPMALVVTRKKIFDAFYADYSENRTFPHSHTYCGNPLAARAALAVLDILRDESVLETAAENARYLRLRLQEELRDLPYIGEIRSINLINAIELVRDVETREAFDPRLRLGYRIYQLAVRKGLLLRPIGDVLYFNPPLTITREEIDFAVRICREAIQETLIKIRN